MEDRGHPDGFTLVELMIVVLIIGILVAIAVPIFASVTEQARRRACFANERTVEGSWQTYGFTATPAQVAAVTDWNSLMTALVPGSLAREPVCGGGGTYQFSSANGTVTCSVHGHY